MCGHGDGLRCTGSGKAGQKRSERPPLLLPSLERKQKAKEKKYFDEFLKKFTPNLHNLK